MLTLAQPDLSQAVWIPTLPFLSMIVCGFLAFARAEKLQRVAGWLTVGAIFAAFLISLTLGAGLAETGERAVIVHFFEWINISDFHGNFSFYIDPLTIVMLSVVTGIGTLIALYAMGYMAGDIGYGRFFAYISLFIFAMTTLVMADNLLLLYLGWEGVGAASFLLIGFYYRKPSAVAAAKKAFIVNRIGDFGFALGLMGTFLAFGSVQYAEILPEAMQLGDAARQTGSLSDAVGQANYLTDYASTGLLLVIPFLLMLGAFGKSAQLPLHVWLPDAMEGPTPVSALIHAATMVTAGVYMIARLITLFQLSPAALDTIATVGGITAIFAATIALCQYDLKRVWAYSTLSQLGYMFLGVGVLGTMGAVFHLFTHAFFKALLFLTAGSVMHAMAGQLDLRKMSGLRHKMPITAGLMLVGCLALAGLPLTAGFYSKDTILANAWVASPVLAIVGIITALLTAFYTFRLWFRVFTGPLAYEMGNEHHGYPMEEHAHATDAAHLPAHTDAEAEAASESEHAPDAHHEAHHHEPHEMPWWPMNAPLLLLAVGSIFGGLAGGWMANMIAGSSARVGEDVLTSMLGITADELHHREHVAHIIVPWVTGVGAFIMIAAAWFFHSYRRDLTAKIADSMAPVVKVLHNKYYIDELYNAVIRLPLNALGWICYIVDSVLIDGLIIDTLFGRTPRLLGWISRSPQRGGALQGYGLAMGLGLVIVLFVIAWKAMAN